MQRAWSVLDGEVRNTNDPLSSPRWLLPPWGGGPGFCWDLSPFSPSGVMQVFPGFGLLFLLDMCPVIGTCSSHFGLTCSDPFVYLDPPLISPIEWRRPVFCNTSNKGWTTKLNTSRHQLFMFHRAPSQQNIYEVNIELIASQHLTSSWAFMLGPLLPAFFPYVLL